MQFPQRLLVIQSYKYQKLDRSWRKLAELVYGYLLPVINRVEGEYFWYIFSRFLDEDFTSFLEHFDRAKKRQ